GICSADSLEMKITRPQFLRSIPGRKWRVSRTPLRTFTAKKWTQSESGISRKGLVSKIPRLFTRMSASGTCSMNHATPSEFPRSAAMPRTSALLLCSRRESSAAATRASVRPLMMTRTPSSASAAAMARPIPAVEPVTTACFPCKPNFMIRFPLSKSQALEAQLERCFCLCHSTGKCFDFGNFLRAESPLPAAHHAFGLFCAARANNGAGNHRIAQRPGNGHFAGSPAVTRADFLQFLHQFQILGEFRLLVLGVAAAKIVGRKSGGALARHAAREHSRKHRGVDNHTDAALCAIRQSSFLDLAAQNGVRG